MEASFIVIFSFLFFQKFGISMIATSNVTCIQRERHSLLQFKQTLSYSDDALQTWSGVECCEWQGVVCDSRNGHVVKLDLPDEFLEGELSHSLKNLKRLRYLDLSENIFSGTIPKFLGSFECLEYLNLANSGFVGVVPYQLGNLSRLQHLDLSNTYVLKGPLLDNMGWVSSLSSLKYLDLTGIHIGNDIDWFRPVNMVQSLLTLNLAYTDINIPSNKFANFTSLNSIDLSFNHITSEIPVWLSNLTDLMHLNLASNNFHGKIPNFLRTFNALASIHLSYNSFNTPIPNLLCNLTSLVSLGLSGNMFSGPIPASIGLLLRLEDLYLQDNQLSGNIPMSLGQLSNLKNLDLSDNMFVGVLSETHFTRLKNLNYLALSRNMLVFNFSSRWNVPFQLHTFFASSCNIGPHFPNWLQTQTNLQSLHLSNSGIRDAIPEWFENILSHIVYLDLSNNRIGGKLPRFQFNSSNQIDDRILKMNSNKFEGSLETFPSNVKILDLSDNLLSGHIPRADGTMILSLNVVVLSKNNYSGSIPAHLCKVSSIRVLDLSQNKFSGRLPECLANLTNLRAIYLSNNTITGVVPSSLGSLKDLRSLHLHNNIFEGEIPSSLQNLTRLLTLDFGKNLFVGTIPFWIGKKLSKLRYLNLESNKFTGSISLHLCQLKALQYISLAHNNLTGMIPHCFGNLRGMKNPDSKTYIYNYNENILASMKGMELLYTKVTIRFLTSIHLSSNNVVGEIPNALMNLVGLKNFNLSGNLLKGQIPMIIGNLKQLESLDLSKNKLCGQIPQSLASLTFLSYLNFSFNNLSGPIPVGNQIQTLDDISIYEGNNGLCGPPLSMSFNGTDVSYSHAGEGVGHQDTQGWFYVGLGSGFVVGFTGFLGSLHFVRRWRVAYFETLKTFYDWLMLLVLLNLARLRKNVFE